MMRHKLEMQAGEQRGSRHGKQVSMHGRQVRDAGQAGRQTFLRVKL